MADQYFWCEYAWLGGHEPSPNVVLIVRDGKLLDVQGPFEFHIKDCIDLPGLTIPGLVNSHSHAFHRMIRGMTHRVAPGDSNDFMGWRESMYRASATLTPDSYSDIAADVYTEMLLAGYTTVGEFHYVHHEPDGRPYTDEHAMELALIGAARSAGIRITLIDACYLHGGVKQPLNESQIRFADQSSRHWESRVEGLIRALRGRSTVRLAGAIHSARAVNPEEMAIVARWTNSRALQLHAHVSELPAENEATLAEYRKTPTQLMLAAGAMRVDHTFTAVHATHLDARDIATLGRTRSFISCCPTTERELADGISPTAELVANGAQLCIGSDSQAIIDPFEEMRGIEMHQRLSTRTRGRHTVAQLLDAGIEAGHRSLGWSNVGKLRTGMAADFVSIDTHAPRFRGIPASHWLDATVFSAGAADVYHVVVNGEVVVRDRQPVRRPWKPVLRVSP